jgi:hypothetical protein
MAISIRAQNGGIVGILSARGKETQLDLTWVRAVMVAERRHISQSRRHNPERPMYTALMIGTIFTVVLAVPAIVWLTKLIRPAKPEEEAIHRGVEEARRRNDRFLY